jgi:seryl-tRNA synthetase
MAFTVQDLKDLLELLERHPEWKSALRASLLGEELLRLPELVREIAAEVRALAEAQKRTEEQVRELAEAQRRTEQRVEELAEAQKRTEEQVRELAEAQRQTEQRVEELAEAQRRTEQRVEELAEAQKRTEEQVRELAEAQRRTEQRVEELAEAQKRTEQRVEELAEAQRQTEQQVGELAAAQRRAEGRLDALERRVGDLVGSDLERRYRERPHAFFQRILKGIHPVPPARLQQLLDEAVRAGRITEDGEQDVLLADVVVVGRRDGEETYLLVEVSGEVRVHDVERAARRAELLRRATGTPTLAAVAGKQIDPEADAEARTRGVWRVLDGVTFPP